MKNAAHIPLVTTIWERCRVCYTCVRECPAKAIRIADGQAEVIAERCVGCGNCVRVCSQRAKRVYDSTGDVARLLALPNPVAAIVAPSFPAEFSEMSYARLIGMIRALGFDYVNEVAFGADIVAERYAELLTKTNGHRYIATNCPAIVAFVERYHPGLTDSLAPIVSPMVAIARVLKEIHGPDLKTVFIGPCIAKKGELASDNIPDEVDAALTFVELRRMFEKAGLRPDTVKPDDWDPPHGGLGALFPISRGLLQAADMDEDLLEGQIVTADGRSHFLDAIKEFESGDLDASLLEVLACNGCINGPGIVNPAPLFSRRSRVSQYVRERIRAVDKEQWRHDMSRFATLDMSRGFTPDDQRIPAPSEEQLRRILGRMGKNSPDDELNCGACGYETCREHAIAVFKGLAENEMCLPSAIDQLRKTIKDLAVSNTQLAETREALLQSEKLASMGQLAAGIAHELNNPLGVVLMYAHLLKDENSEDSKLEEDLSMITEQADRCKKIVSGLLHFARQNKVELVETELRDLVARALRSCPAPTGVTIDVQHESGNLCVPLDRDQMLQVFANLIGNAYAAMPHGGTLTIRTWATEHQAKIAVSDTGTGITKQHMEKIFEPFFTTKDIGKGTGLGLAVTYGIVKMHRGDIRVESNADPQAGPTGTTFTVSLPR